MTLAKKLLWVSVVTVLVLRFPSYVARLSERSRADAKYDGFLLGAGGAIYSPGTPLPEMAGVRPAGKEPEGKAVFVNGVLHDVRRASQQLGEVADATGLEVVGLYNAAERFADVLSLITDVFYRADTRANRSLTALLTSELAAGRSIKVFAHSQGAQVLSTALGDVRQAQLRKGLQGAKLLDTLAQVEAETWGSTCSRFPDGPTYRHVANVADPLAKVLFCEPGFADESPLNRLGLDAAVHTFRTHVASPPSLEPAVPIGTHELQVYLEGRATRPTVKTPATLDAFSEAPRAD